MITNRALGELKCWSELACSGRGEEAKQHLVNFGHMGAGFIASTEFQRRFFELFGRCLEPGDVEQTCKLLDAIANIEVWQVEKSGCTADGTPLHLIGQS
jgi:hypothetical protein